MSYILDALRRADAERERGTVPGLHTQQYSALPDDDEAPARPWLLIGAVAVLSLALAGVVAWNLLGTGAAPARTSAQAQGSVTETAAALPAAGLPAVATAPSGAASAAMAAPAPTVSGAPTATASSAAGAAKAAASTATKTAAVAEEPVRKRVARKPPKPVAEKPDTPSGSGAPAAKPANAAPVLARADLPEQVRRDLPQLNLGGSSYSSDAASRMVILNGQVFHEGDTIAPGLVLQQVQPKGAVLGFKGYRFKLGS